MLDMPTHTVVTYGEGGYDPKAPDGNVVEVETHEVEPMPLDQHAQTLVLLTVKGYITEDEAAAVSGRTKADLAAEAEAWTVASADSPSPRVAGLMGMTRKITSISTLTSRSAPIPSSTLPAPIPTPHIDASTHGRFTRTDVFFAIILIITLLTTLLLVAFL